MGHFRQIDTPHELVACPLYLHSLLNLCVAAKRRWSADIVAKAPNSPVLIFLLQSEVNALAARYLENHSVAAETFGLLRVLPGRCINSEVQSIVNSDPTLISTRRSKPHAEKCRQ
jgi:hypothetical protein